MSDLKSIKDLKKEFNVVAETTPSTIVDSRVEDLEKEIFALKAALDSAQAALNQFKIQNDISSEEIICVEQIEILKVKSAVRELSLDEIKRLDLLVKNLKLIRTKDSDAIDIPNLDKLGEDHLVAIARGEDQ